MNNEKLLETKPAMPKGRGRYFAGIIICIILLYLFNNMLSVYVLSIQSGSNVFKALMSNNFVEMRSTILSNKFIDCLWAINLALGLGIMGNFALLFYRPKWFVYWLQAVLLALGLLPVRVVHKVSPFTIDSQALVAMVKTGLIVFMILLAIGALFLFVRGAVIFVRKIRNFELL